MFVVENIINEIVPRILACDFSIIGLQLSARRARTHPLSVLRSGRSARSAWLSG
ncbi:MAG TPA: hypothetical protein VIJ67_13590 [Pseudolabrys sp.]